MKLKFDRISCYKNALNKIKMNILDHIQIVLVETSLPANIGSAARAMKTMGLSHLRLVEPKHPLDEDAFALSAGAKDLLENAKTFATFDEAVADCQLVIGTSAACDTYKAV